MSIIYYICRLYVIPPTHRIFQTLVNFSGFLRDSLLFDFGAMLMSKGTHWIFGLDYLQQCSVEGTSATELFLSKIVIQNEKQAMKIINIAKNRGLVDVGE